MEPAGWGPNPETVGARRVGGRQRGRWGSHKVTPEKLRAGQGPEPTKRPSERRQNEISCGREKKSPNILRGPADLQRGGSEKE